MAVIRNVLGYGVGMLLNLNRTNGVTFAIISVLVVSQHVVECNKCSSNDRVSIYPKGAKVHEGGSTLFVCILHTRNSFLSAVIHWQNRESKTLTSFDHIVIFTETDELNNSATFEMRLVNIYEQMGGSYQCAVAVSYNDCSALLHSDFVQLKVISFLESEELQCNGEDAWEVRDGDMVSLECKVLKNISGIRLEWRPFTSKINNSYFQNDLSQGGSLRGIYKIGKSDHNKLVYCIARSKYSPELSVSCSIGPFVVVQEPVVRIYPTGPIVIPTFAPGIVVNCFASGFPSDFEFRWTCHSAVYILSTCDSRNSSLTLNLHDILPIETLKITCSVSNSEGISDDTLSVTVGKIREENIPACSDNFTLSAGISGVSLTHVSYPENEHFHCFNRNGNHTLSSFRWFLNGNQLPQSHGNYSILQKPDGSTELIIYDYHHMREFASNKPAIVACQITYPHSVSHVACSINGKSTANDTYFNLPTAKKHPDDYGLTRFSTYVNLKETTVSANMSRVDYKYAPRYGTLWESDCCSHCVHCSRVSRISWEEKMFQEKLIRRQHYTLLS